MIDIRDADAMVTSLRDAQRRFEKGAPVPHAARELLDQVLDALADSGPLELGVTPTAWLRAIGSVERGIAAADDGSSREAARRVQKAIRELESFFDGRGLTWAQWLFLPVSLAMLVFLMPLILLFLLIESVKKRYVPDARKVATGLELPDRLLFAHAVKADRSEVSSAARAWLGAYVHPVLIATDRRLVLAQPRSELPIRSSQQPFTFAWEVPYPRTRSFSSTAVGSSEVITIHTREREITYKMPSVEGNALVAILKRRAPEAFTNSVASPAEVAVAAS